MSFTGYARYTTGVTLYVKPLPLNNAPWSTGVITGSENGTLGSYSFSTLDEGTEYELFIQAGGSPASTDIAIGKISLLVNAIAIDDSQIAATNLKQSSLAVATGTVQANGSNSATSFMIDSTLGAKAADYFGDGSGGMVLAFVAGAANEYQSRRVIAFNTTTDFITVEQAFNATPTASDAFVLLGRITELS